MHSSSLNSSQDIIKAEENILAQHELFKKNGDRTFGGKTFNGDI